jgi:hypothetical protein
MAEQELAEAVRTLATVFEQRQVQHALIGGLAVAQPTACNEGRRFHCFRSRSNLSGFAGIAR